MQKTYFIILSLFTILVSCNSKSVTKNDVLEIIDTDNIKEFNQIQSKINIDTLTFTKNRTLLHFALIQGAKKISKQLITESKFIHELDADNVSPLIITIAKRYNHLTDLLLQKNVDVNIVQTNLDISSLNYVIDDKNLELLKKLVAHKANLFHKRKNGNTLLHSAVSNSNSDIVNYLLNKKLSDTIKNKNGQTVLDIAIYNDDIEIQKIFLDRFSPLQKRQFIQNLMNNNPLNNITIVDTTATTPVKQKQLATWLSQKWISKINLEEVFIKLKDTNAIKAFLNKGIDINFISNEKNVALIHNAAIGHRLGLMNFILANGGNINLVSKDEKTPLMYSLGFSTKFIDYPELNNKIEKAGFKFTNKFKDFSQINFEATIEDKIYFINFLIAKGSNISYKNSNDENALYVAQSVFNEIGEKLLLDNGAKITKEYKLTKWDKEALKQAEKRDYQRRVEEVLR